MKSTHPQVTPTSATLNTGKSMNTGLMKSMTYVCANRSMALPMPPATTSERPTAASGEESGAKTNR